MQNWTSSGGTGQSATGTEKREGDGQFPLRTHPARPARKELARFATMMGGAPGESVERYENVTIAEMLQGQQRTGITVTFPNESCPGQTDH